MIRRSAHIANSSPPATLWPDTAAMTGLLRNMRVGLCRLLCEYETMLPGQIFCYFGTYPIGPSLDISGSSAFEVASDDIVRSAFDNIAFKSFLGHACISPSYI
jgi:hypothetical protein